MKVVQFGAGCIGRGFLSPLYRQSGYEIVYVDIDSDLVALLNRRKSYPLELVDSAGASCVQVIDSFSALPASDTEAVAEALSEADLAAVSVGADKLTDTAPWIAAGIARRREHGKAPLDILLCENLRHPAGIMRERLAELLGPEEQAWAIEHVGLVDMVVGRMVPKSTPESLAADPLRVITEPHGELLAGRDCFRGDIPRLEGMEPVEPIDAYFTRKLYTLNTAHAALAYLGYPKYSTIWQCLLDDGVRRTAEAALAESAQALTAEYGFALEEMNAYCAGILRRLSNAALGDTVERVAAGPMRKLGPCERLVGAARLCEQHSISPVALADVIDAALAYDNHADPGARQMQRIIKEIGRRRFLEEHCHIAPLSQLGELLVTLSGESAGALSA